MRFDDVKKIVYIDILIIVFAIFSFAFVLISLLTTDVNASEMQVYCSSGNYSNCVSLAQGSNASTLNTNVITNYNTSTSYRYVSITSMPLQPSTKYTFKIYFTPAAVSIKNIFYRFRTITIDGPTEDYQGYVSATYDSAWGINGSSYVNVASFNITTRDNYSISTNNFINLDFNQTGITIKKIEISETDVQNSFDIAKTVRDVLKRVAEDASTCFTNSSIKISPALTGAYISSNTGQTGSNADFNVSSYYGVVGGESYSIYFKNYTNLQYGYLCWYNGTSVVSCSQYRNISGYGSDPLVVTAPANAEYISLTYRKNSDAEIKGNICYNTENEILNSSNETNQKIDETNQKIDETNQKIDETNDYLKDDSNPTVDSSGINNAISNASTSNPLSYLLTLPTKLLNATLTGLSSNSCTAWRIGRFGTIGRHDLGTYEFNFPCINLKAKLGDNLYNIIDVFVAIGIFVATIVKLYDTISNYLTLGADSEAKSHSAFLSPMDFLGNLLSPDLSVRASLQNARDFD